MSSFAKATLMLAFFSGLFASAPTGASPSAASEESVAAIFPLSPDAIVRKLLTVFPDKEAYSQEKATVKGKLSRYELARNDKGLIDFQFRFSEGGFAGDAPLSLYYHEETADPDLRRWITLPREQAKHDVKLEFKSDYSRESLPESETTVVNGKRYLSDYILHLEPVDAGHTKLTVIGLSAKMLNGKTFRLGAQDGLGFNPRRVDNWESVVPAAQDKRDTLAALESLLR